MLAFFLLLVEICFIFYFSLTFVHDSEVLLLFHLAMGMHLVSAMCDSISLAGKRECASHDTPCAAQMLMLCLKEGNKSYCSLEAWKGTWEHLPSTLPLLISRCSFSKRHLPCFFIQLKTMPDKAILMSPKLSWGIPKSEMHLIVWGLGEMWGELERNSEFRRKMQEPRARMVLMSQVLDWIICETSGCLANCIIP